MLRNFCLKFGLFVLIGFCTHCKTPSLPPEPIDKEDTTGTDTSHIDTSIISKPDTTHISDTVRARTSDSSLAYSRRFGTEFIFSENDLESKAGIYYKANDFIGRPVNLNYSFVAPARDTLKYRPFVLMVHEGAFLFGDLGNELGKARLLARKGYAAASINYRLGFNGGSQANACGGNNLEVIQAVYRAVQDTYAALHYFAGKADEFGIDPGQIVLAGSSAGAIAISAAVYMTEQDFEALQPGIVKTLGKLDPNPKGAPFKVTALLSSLGYGVFKSSYLTTANAKPTVFFQRTGDNVLPFQKGTFLSCPFYLSSEGAKPVSDQLKKLKVPYELNFETASGHQLSYPQDYITDRYAQFMKRLWSGNKHQITNEKYKTIEDIQLK
jgi:hypothetical protein